MKYYRECLICLLAFVISLGVYVGSHLGMGAAPDPLLPAFFAGGPLILAGFRASEVRYRIQWSYYSVRRQEQLLKDTDALIYASSAWSLGFLSGMFIFGITLRGAEIFLDDAAHILAFLQQVAEVYGHYAMPALVATSFFLLLMKQLGQPH